MSDETKNPEQVIESVTGSTPQLSQPELINVVGGAPTTTLSNIANLQHDMQKTVANNIRA